jgi:hypothetical protein
LGFFSQAHLCTLLFTPRDAAKPLVADLKKGMLVSVLEESDTNIVYSSGFWPIFSEKRHGMPRFARSCERE